MNNTTCGICGKPIKKEWPDRHDYHEYDCPNFVDFVTNPEAGSQNYPCDCDLVAHPECCPQCNKIEDDSKNKNHKTSRR